MDGAHPGRSRDTLRLEIESINGRLDQIFGELVALTLKNFHANKPLPMDINILCETYDELLKQQETRRKEAEALAVGPADPSLLEASKLERGAIQARLDGVTREIGRGALKDYGSTRDLPRDLAVLCETFNGLLETLEARKKQLEEMAPPEAPPPPAQAPAAPVAPPARQEPPMMQYIPPPVSMKGHRSEGAPRFSKLLLPLYIIISIGLVVLALHFFSMKIATPSEISFDGSLIYFEKTEPTMQEQKVDAWKVIFRLDKVREEDSLRTAKSPITVVRLLDNSVRLGSDSCVRFSSLRRSDENSIVKLLIPYGRVWIDKSASMKLMVQTKGGTLNAADLCSELRVDKGGGMKFIAWKGNGSYTDNQTKTTQKVEEGSCLNFKEAGGAVKIEPWHREKRDAWQDWNLRYTIDEIYACTVPPVGDRQ